VIPDDDDSVSLGPIGWLVQKKSERKKRRK
jgi:hypothetical protein